MTYASDSVRARMLTILAELKASHPGMAERLSLSTRGSAVGLDTGDSIAIIYATVADTDQVVFCDMGGGRFPSHDKADW